MYFLEKEKINLWKFSLLSASDINKSDRRKGSTYLQAPCVVAEMVCSEESHDEDEEDSTFVIRPFPWRNDKANTPFASFNSKFNKIHSKCAVMAIYYSEGLSSDPTRLFTVPK